MLIDPGKTKGQVQAILSSSVVRVKSPCKMPECFADRLNLEQPLPHVPDNSISSVEWPLVGNFESSRRARASPAAKEFYPAEAEPLSSCYTTRVPSHARAIPLAAAFPGPITSPDAM